MSRTKIYLATSLSLAIVALGALSETYVLNFPLLLSVSIVMGCLSVAFASLYIRSRRRDKEAAHKKAELELEEKLSQKLEPEVYRAPQQPQTQPLKELTLSELIVKTLDNGFGKIDTKIDLKASFPVNQKVEYHGIEGSVVGTINCDMKYDSQTQTQLQTPKPAAVTKRPIED